MPKVFVIKRLVSFRERLAHHDVAREPPIIDAKLDLELALTATSSSPTIAYYLNDAAIKTAPRLPSSVNRS